MSHALQVKDVMSRRMVTVGADVEVEAVRAAVLEGHHRHALVTDAEGVLRGVVSHRDLLTFRETETIGGSPTVAQVMTTPAVTVEQDATLAAAAQLMFERRLGCLPVLDQGAVVGLLTEADFVRHLGRR